MALRFPRTHERRRGPLVHVAGVIVSTGNRRASIDVPTTLLSGRTDWLVGGLPAVVGGDRFGAV